MVVACVAHGEGGRRSGSRRAGEDQRSQRADVRVAEVASKQSAVVARGASESVATGLAVPPPGRKGPSQRLVRDHRCWLQATAGSR